MADVSPRLRRRIQSDFTEPGSAEEIARLVSEASDSERIQAAIVFCARGDLTRLRGSLELARTDWRDVLMCGELAHEDWPAKLETQLGPPS
ncbi:hypothetical protein [Kribbella sp. NPDC000426]|uniref:hypothetical protein n=1 Tax=Kribbella sp. NPDC000426 TaxID=3154255 RepID=UPI003316A158